MYDDAGLPEGAYQTILATNEQIAETVIPDPRVRGVSVTGSERAGAAVAEVAGRNLKKVVLEMGGSDPFIVLATENLDEVVDAAVEARLDNTGQSCNAAKRFIVVDELYDDFLAKFTAEDEGGRARGSDRGPGDGAALVVDRRRAPSGPARPGEGPGRRGGARRRTEGQLLRRHGAGRDQPRQRRLPGGVLRPGRERLQGRLRGGGDQGRERHAVRARLLRLHDDPEQADRVAESLDTGMVFVNGVLLDGAELPFGGVKRSGFGRELGPYGMDEFVNKKLIRVVK